MSRRPANDAPRPITDIVLSSDVAGLATRAGKLADLGVRLNRVLPSALGAQVHLANLRDRKLVFLATSPAWATRLRYSQALVLEAARQLGLDAQGIVVKVAASLPAEPAGPVSEPLSETAARHLELAARLLDRP
jgi:hypothetical protein